MHACRHPWTILTLAIVLLAAGCRGTTPGGLVKVTEEPSADFRVDPLPQRLASAHSEDRPEEEPSGDATNSQATRMVQKARQSKQEATAMNHRAATQTKQAKSNTRPHNRTVGTIAAQRNKDPHTNKDPHAGSDRGTSSVAKKQTTPSSRDAARSDAMKALMAANRGVSSQAAAKTPPSPATRSAPPQQRPAPPKQRRPVADEELPLVTKTASSPRPRSEKTKSSDAFASSSPDIQRQAIQRFVNAAAKQADRTTQPHALNHALAQSLTDLPQLPAAKNKKPTTPPKRLAMAPRPGNAKPQRAQVTQAQQAKIAQAEYELSDDDQRDVIHVADVSRVSSPQPVAKQPAVVTADHTDEDAGRLATTDAAKNEVQPVRHTDAPTTGSPTKKPSQSQAGAEPLDLLVGLETRIVEPAPAPQQEGVRPAAASSEEPGNVAQAVAKSDPPRDAKVEIPLPPLSLATPAPTGDFLSLDSIRSTAATAPTKSPEPVAPTPEFLSDAALYKELLQRLSQPAVGETEAERSRRLIMARHLMVLAGNPDEAAKKMEGLSKQEQQYLQHQLAGLWKMIDPKGHPVAGRRFSSALPELREATKYLAAATDSLEINSLSFCTEIEAFGQIKTFPGNRFQPGQQVILYCEVDNFSVAEVEHGFETHLQGSYDVYNANNEKVISQMLPADRQVASKYLRDYFIAYQMNLPKQLTPGTYRLQLTMEDVAGKKYGQASVPFEIAAE